MTPEDALSILMRPKVSQEQDWQARRTLGLDPEPVTVRTDLRVAAMGEYPELT
jgi:hypothetical protein